MKKIIILSLISVSFIVSITFLFMLPYTLYSHVIKSGSESKYLNLPPIPSSMVKGYSFEPEKLQLFNVEKNSLWKMFHLSHLVLPLPLSHPQVKMLPRVKHVRETNKMIFGADFVNSEKFKYISFWVGMPFRLSLNFDDMKILALPFFKKEVLNVSLKKIWIDLFQRDLEKFALKDSNSFAQNISLALKTRFKDLIYNLYIYYFRTQLFPENIKKMSFYQKKQFGIFEIESSDKRLKKEVIYILHQGVVYPMILISRAKDMISRVIRDSIMQNVMYQKIDENEAHSLYIDYREALTLEQRSSHEGMVYLFSAWSQAPANKKILDQMIQFLERGKNNMYFLGPLYEYLQKRYGYDAFVRSRGQSRRFNQNKNSSKSNKKQETSKLNTKAKEFKSENQRVKSFIHKVNQEGYDLDKEENALFDD